MQFHCFLWSGPLSLNTKLWEWMIGPLRLSARERKWEGGVSGRMFIWEPGTEPLRMHKVGIFVSSEGRYMAWLNVLPTRSLFSLGCVTDWNHQWMMCQVKTDHPLMVYTATPSLIGTETPATGLWQQQMQQAFVGWIRASHSPTWNTVSQEVRLNNSKLFCGTCGGLAVSCLVPNAHEQQWRQGQPNCSSAWGETLTQDWHSMGLQIDGFWIPDSSVLWSRRHMSLGVS